MKIFFMDYGIDIFHYIHVYKRNSGLIASLTVTAMLISAIFGYAQPAAYKSTCLALYSGQLNQKIISGVSNISVNRSKELADVIFPLLKNKRMGDDINARFGIKKVNWRFETYFIPGGFAVEVTGPDPEMTKNIANFILENFQKINSELQITSTKQMFKVLDPAENGVLTSNEVYKRIIFSGFFVFLSCILFIFFKEYFPQFRKSQTQ